MHPSLLTALEIRVVHSTDTPRQQLSSEEKIKRVKRLLLLVLAAILEPAQEGSTNLSNGI